jgi:alcohol dehydrogenase, propanol-preferring
MRVGDAGAQPVNRGLDGALVVTGRIAAVFVTALKVASQIVVASSDRQNHKGDSMSSSATYRAVQVVARGKFELAELPVQDPPAGHVRIRVEACGVCFSDFATVDAFYYPVEFPRVPGHEIVGRIDALGAGVTSWEVGQRVGVGWLGGNCGSCSSCRHADFVNCANQPITGVLNDGGYAEMTIARASALAAIPDELESADAAPLLCGGLTTFNALRNSGARPGDLVAVVGIGGLGHLALQYARSAGLRVVAIARGEEKRATSIGYGAHHYIDSLTENVAGKLQEMGGAQVIFATTPSAQAMNEAIPGLKPHGKLIVLGIPLEPIQAAAPDLVLAWRSVTGLLTGTAADTEDTLNYSVLQDIRASTDTWPLEKAVNAYESTMRGQARYRNVIVI